MNQELRELYQQVILDHNKSPRNFRKMENATQFAEGYNPLCGDHIDVFLLIEDGIVKDVSFKGEGCAISKASASLMTSILKGKSNEEAEKLFEKFHSISLPESLAIILILMNLASLLCLPEFRNFQ